MKKHLIISICSAALKVIGTVALVVILARVFSLADFGNFTYSLTLGTLLSLLVDFGYNLKVIRDVSLEGANIKKVATSAFFSKIALFIFALIILVIGQNILDIDNKVKMASLLIFLSFSFYSLTNTFLSVFKGLRKYLLELKLVAFDNIMTFVGVSIVAFLTNDIVWASLSFMISRILSFIYSLWIYLQEYGMISPKVKMIKEDILEALPYAAHYWVGNAYLNIDTIIMETMVSVEKIGIYQSGIRIVMGLGVLLTAINAVYLPLFNEANSRGREVLIGTVKKINGRIILFAVLVAIVMILFDETIILILYGNKFLELNTFFWVFAVIVFLRIIGASYGILLTISNKQTLRAIAGFLSIIIITVLDYYLIPIKGYVAAAYVLLAAHVFMTVFYVVSVYLEHGSFFVPNIGGLNQTKPKK